ncbi:hypothetical protein H4F52_05140 [Pectobacterium brasiliense]|uniref:hypothetical protein n=1 Tax=Pectobacterium brasiliense TaxID=180957 RepID=UPI0019690BBF|nr:hypothetical protein [Pectobacterium brasiliense]MBN3131139.1 hypothetical protein [Pectobacterium brasiliense]
MLELFQYEHEAQHLHNVMVNEDSLDQFVQKQYFRLANLLSKLRLHYALVLMNNLGHVKSDVFSQAFYL